MSLYLGNKEVTGLYKGDKGVTLYKGDSEVFSAGGGNVVHIGDHDYNYVKINNLLWTCEYLRENVGDYIQHQTNGFFYHANVDLQNQLASMLPDGWRIPSMEDIDNLENFVVDPKKILKEENGGTNEFGLNIGLNGYSYNKQEWVFIGSRSYFWGHKTDKWGANPVFLVMSDSFARRQTIGTSVYLQVRLVKDA